jgi:hypothetical protein
MSDTVQLAQTAQLLETAELLVTAQAAGLLLAADGDNLVIEADCDPPAELLAALREHKAELIDFLRRMAVDEPGERAAIVEEGASVPRQWAEGYAALCTMGPPTGFSLGRWQRVVDAAGVFLDSWAGTAIACGWSDLDVFGCDPTRPDARFDCMGLVLLLDRCEVVAVDEQGADLMTATGARQRFRRRPLPAATVPLWQLREVND